MKFPAKEFEISNYLAHRKSSLNPNYSYLSNKRGAHAYWFWKIPPHSVLEQIWVKGSYLSKWLPQGERGPPKESKSRWIEILHIGSQFT